MMSHPRLRVLLDFGAGSTPLPIGECLWVQSERVAAFQWSPEALAAGYDLAPLFMPLRPEAMKASPAPFNGLHGLFADSIPDGFGLRLMDKGLAAAGQDPRTANPLVRLAWIGSRGAGALSYEPVIDGGDSQELMDIAELGAHAAKAEEEIFADIPKSAIRAGGSALGARPKFWAAVAADGRRVIVGDSARSPEGFTPCLVKFAPALGDSNEPFYEAACLELAQDHGVRAARFRLLENPNGAALAVERFDRTPGGGRIFVQSVAALLNSDFRREFIDYEDLAKLSARLSPALEGERIYRQTCFNVALSMRDDHSKNFAFCMDSHGHWELSPAFDLCPSDGMHGWHTTTVSNEGMTITSAHLLGFAKKLGLPIPVARDGIDQALAAACKFESKAIYFGSAKTAARKWGKRFAEIAKDLSPVMVQVGASQKKPTRGPSGGRVP
jgi:serine/threonine-protein kinase HipA